MAGKTFLVVCASALVVKIISAQCISSFNAGLPGPAFISDTFSLGGPGPAFGPGYGSSCGSFYGINGMAPSNLDASYGGGLIVTSSSPIAPTGLTVTSENAIDGALAIAGNLPFLGTVAVEGAYQTVGAGAVSYGCGNGAIGITAENTAPIVPAIAPSQYVPAVSYGGMPGYGFGPAPYAGCGALY